MQITLPLLQLRPIEGYTNKYSASNDGRIFSHITNKFLKPVLSGKCKYLKVNIGANNSRLVHRLVAKAFIPNKDNKTQVNHKDGNKLNNHVDNLEWVSHKENCLHNTKINTKKYPLNINDIITIKNSNLDYYCLAKIYNVTYMTISRIVRGKRWSSVL